MSIPKISFLLLPLLFGACASRQVAPSPAPGATQLPTQTTSAEKPGPSQSRVEISYVLGHVRRKFIVNAGKDQVWAVTYLEDQILEQGRLDPQQYGKFLSDAHEIASQLQSTPRAPATEGGACRSPFKLTVESDGKVQSAQGCREPGHTGISRLVRKGEFLLFSTR